MSEKFEYWIGQRKVFYTEVKGETNETELSKAWVADNTNENLKASIQWEIRIKGETEKKT